MTTLFISDSDRMKTGGVAFEVLLPYDPMLTKTEKNRKNLKSENFEKKKKIGDVVNR